MKENKEPVPGERYLHFKNKEYEIIGVARDCENPERKVVVYKQLYESKTPIGTLWIRELNEFLGFKEFKEDTAINGKVFRKGEKVKRFKLIDLVKKD